MYKTAVVIALAAVFGAALASDRYYPQQGYSADHSGYGGYGGHWSYWGEWSYCTKTCGGGFQTRTRDCQRSYHTYGQYSECDGDASETRECNTDGCPVDGGWSAWGDFGDCSVECGHGTRSRSRTCTYPAAANGGDDCYGDDTDTNYCYIYKCPVDGGWSHWTNWSSCSGNCGSGSRVRGRTCTYPAAANGGDDCEGDSTEVEDCTHYRKCYDSYRESNYGYRSYGQRTYRGRSYH